MLYYISIRKECVDIGIIVNFVHVSKKIKPIGLLNLTCETGIIMLLLNAGSVANGGKQEQSILTN